MNKDLSHIRGVIWDLDGTLYRYDDLFRKACNIAAARTVLDLGLAMSYDDALALAAESERLHGNSFKLFGALGIRYEDYHDPYHRLVDTTIILKNREMLEALKAISLPMVILTNASRIWAQRTLLHLEMDSIFGDGNLIALEDVNYQSKSSGPAGFLKGLDILGVPASHTLMVEDLAANLPHAKKLGMTTALVHHGVVPKEEAAYVDLFFQDTFDLATALAA